MVQKSKALLPAPGVQRVSSVGTKCQSTQICTMLTKSLYVMPRNRRTRSRESLECKCLRAMARQVGASHQVQRAIDRWSTVAMEHPLSWARWGMSLLAAARNRRWRVIHLIGEVIKIALFKWLSSSCRTYKLMRRKLVLHAWKFSRRTSSTTWAMLPILIAVERMSLQVSQSLW